MSEPIKVGDLVMVVLPAPCCGSATDCGKVFKVSRFSSKPPHCGNCNAPCETLACSDTPYVKTELSRLKRIDPPAIGDSLPTRKTVKEPA